MAEGTLIPTFYSILLLFLTVMNGSSGMDAEQSPTVYILGLVPLPSSQPSLAPIYDGGHSLVPTLRLAIEHINNSSEVLPDYTLDVVIGDSGCDIDSKAVISLVQYALHSSKPIVGVVGPACSPSALAIGSLNREGRLGFVQITTGTSPLLRNQTNYPITYGIVSSSLVFADTIFQLMEENRWNRVTVFYETSQTYFSSFYQSFLEEFLRENLEENLIVSEITESFISLQETQRRGHRVLIVIASATPARSLVCFAYHNDVIFPFYQFIFPDKRLSDFLRPEPVIALGKFNCSMDQMKKAINGSILMDYNFNSSAPEDATVSGRTVAQVQAEYSQKVVEYGKEINMNVSEDIYAFPYYDAVWALAMGLNSSVHLLEEINRNLSNLSVYWSAASEIISDQVSNVRFPGTSGHVSFDSATGPDVGTVVDILQLDKGTALYLGYYSASSNMTLNITGGMFIKDSFDVKFNTLHPAVTAISALITTVALAFLIAFHVATVYYRDEPAVKASSPRLSNLIFIGCYFLIIATIMRIAQDSVTDETTSKQFCICYIWFLNNGCTLVFGTLLVKLWRLYRIFVHTFSSEEKDLSDLMLFIYVMILFVVDLVLLIIWMSAFPLKVTAVDVSKDPPIKEMQNMCQYSWFGLFELVYKVLLLLAVLYLSIINRHIRQKEFKHTVIINILVYSLCCVAEIGLPLVFVFRELHLDVNAINFSVFVLLMSTVFLFQFLLFLPPLLPALRKRVDWHSI